MSLRNTFTIAFSPSLQASSVDKKQKALYALLELIEASPAIEDESVEGIHILETIYSLFVSFVEERDVLRNYRLTVALHEIAHDHVPALEGLGFDLPEKKDNRFVMAQHG